MEFNLFRQIKSAHLYGDTDSKEYSMSCTNGTHEQTNNTYACSVKRQDCIALENIINDVFVNNSNSQVKSATRRIIMQAINEIDSNENLEDFFTLK